MQKTRLALLRSDGIVSKGIEGIIKQSNFSSLGLCEFDTLSQLLQSKQIFELLLFDISSLSLQEMEDELNQIRLMCPATKTIVISSRFTVPHIRRIMQLGAKGFIYREELADSLLHSIDLVLRDVVNLSRQALELLTTSNLLVSSNDMKPRQMAILRYTAEGLNPKEIALKLNVDVRTVQRDKRQLREILDVATNDLLLDAAREQGLLDDEIPP